MTKEQLAKASYEEILDAFWGEIRPWFLPTADKEDEEHLREGIKLYFEAAYIARVRDGTVIVDGIQNPDLHEGP